MTWELYRWTWRVTSPLFIGTTPSGALNRCRIYVPARPLWGAITAELARLEGGQDPPYQQVGDELRERARFSYLFPAERRGDAWQAWLPEYREGDGLVWSREGDAAVLTDRNIRRQLLGTRPATAIDPDSDSALDGSLRETECVQTSWRRGESAANDPVAMVGYVFVRKDGDLARRLPALDRIIIGGDTRYGLGRLDRVGMTLATTLFGATVDLGQANPHVFASRLLAHAPFQSDFAMCGDLEALGGWNGTEAQQGPVVTSALALMPGSAAHQLISWSVDKTGFWKQQEGPSGNLRLS